MQTFQTVYDEMRQRLTAAAIENPALEARWILKHVLGVSDTDLIAGTVKPFTSSQKDQIDSIVARRLEGEPLSRIFGEREFRGLNFRLGPDTLDPRPDTEILVEKAVEKFHVKQNHSPEPLEILDLGTGSGCVLISLLMEIPEAIGTGVDLSPEACKISLHNANILGVSDRVHFVCGSWGESLAPGRFDLIVANPPYITSADIQNLDENVRNHDPILALDGGPDGLAAYKKIFSDLPRLLKKGGSAFFEIGFNQKDDIERLSKESWIRIEAVHPDLAGRPRVVEISCGDK